MNKIKTVMKKEWIDCFIPYLYKKRTSITLLFALRMISSLLTIIHPLLFSRIINNLLNTEKKAMWWGLVLFLSLQVLMILINCCARAIDLRIAKEINLDVKASIDKFLIETPALQTTLSKGKMYSLLVSDSNCVYSFCSSLMFLLFTVVTLIGVGIVAISIHWKLSLLLLVPYPMELIINLYFRDKLELL